MSIVRFRKWWARNSKVPNGHSVLQVSQRETRSTTDWWSKLELPRPGGKTWQYLRGKMEISPYLGTKLAQAQVQKDFNRPPRRAAQLCRSPWILHIPHFAPLTSATCNPAKLHTVRFLWWHLSLPDLLLSSGVAMEDSDLDRIKGQTPVPGKCNQVRLERGLYPPLSECPESFPLISSHWARLRE